MRYVTGLFLAFLAIHTTGCSYLNCRAKDFNDQFVYNVGVGLGLNTHVRATRWIQTGLGTISLSTNVGYLNRSTGFCINEEYDLSGLIAGFMVNQVAEYTPQLDSNELRLMAIPLSYGRAVKIKQSGSNLYQNSLKTYRVTQDRLKKIGASDDKSVVDLFTGMDYYDGNVAIFYNLNPLADREGTLKFRLVEEFSIEVKAAAFVVAARLGFNPVETLDFVLGFLGIDICEDDEHAVFDFPIREVLERPVREIIGDDRDYK